MATQHVIRGGGLRRLLGWATLIVTVLFAMLAMEHAAVLFTDRLELESHLHAWLTSSEYIFGEGSIRYAYASYHAGPVKMALHMALGGSAMLLGVTQFVPRLRRRYPKLHRGVGVFVWVATLLSMIGAMIHLTVTPMADVASGPAFWLALWLLAALTLFVLGQAIASVRARDFRSHMIWMAMVFACLGTAPGLRIDWVVFYWLLPHNHEWINLGTTGFVLLQTIFVMTVWLHWTGDADLPVKRRIMGAPELTTPLAERVVVGLSAMTAVVAVHEGVLVGMGLDLLQAWRAPIDVLPMIAAGYALAVAATMTRMPAMWRSAVQGAGPTWSTGGLVGLIALCAIMAGLYADQSTLATFSVAAVWIGYGGYVLCNLGMAALQTTSRAGRNGWWTTTLATLWAPALWPFVLLPGIGLGATFSEANYAALLAVAAVLAMGGVAVGYGARLVVPFRPAHHAVQPNRTQHRAT
ncbi:MAG: DUF2306 domain-containing protein [Myxococcota bacterium]